MQEEEEEICRRQPKTNLLLLEKVDIFIDKVDSNRKTETIHMARLKKEQAAIVYYITMSNKNNQLSICFFAF